jgi:hypothetical protein
MKNKNLYVTLAVVSLLVAMGLGNASVTATPEKGAN